MEPVCHYKNFFYGLKHIYSSLVGIMAFTLYTMNTLLSCAALCVISIVRIIPLQSCQNSWHRWVASLVPIWVSINTLIQNITIPKTQWIVESSSAPLEQILHPDHWYLLISNHQSWVDILVLQRVLHGHIPFPKFFFKRELLWTLPFASWVCWLLNFPLVYRHSREQMIKRPELKTRNLEITRNACEAYKQFPTTIANFVEGSRFSQSKHDLQASPYHYLLKPHTGGIALSLAILNQHLDKVLNITICYNSKKISFWNFLCGDISSIKVYIEPLPITSDLIGDYQQDREFRVHIQQWLNQLWLRKDQLIQHHMLSKHHQTNNE